jgi:hypothetical protein
MLNRHLARALATERIDQRSAAARPKAAQQNFVLSVRILPEIARNAKSYGHPFGTALLPIGQSLTHFRVQRYLDGE